MEITTMHEDLNMRENQGNSAMSGFLLGAVVGAGLALMFAPAPGIETRRRIGETAKRMRDRARDRVDQARGTMNDLKDEARSAMDSGREAFNRNRRQGSENFGEPSSEARPV